MAIETVNARYEGFIFDGENSRDYGVYVTDVEVFGAPVRNVEMISIPGRNGSFALDKGSYENIQVTYKCAMGCESQADFNDGISAFRNMLASRTGYKRLEDEINTSEYRMACFRGGISVPTLNKETATFDVVFDCKPQRYLKSGENEVSVASGGTISNPTLYDASPLLKAKGTGDIMFRNEAATTITESYVGDITLSSSVTDSGTGTITPAPKPRTSVLLSSTDMLNNGDSITLKGIKYTWAYMFPNNVSTISATSTAGCSVIATKNGRTATFVAEIDTLNLVSGTDISTPTSVSSYQYNAVDAANNNVSGTNSVEIKYLSETGTITVYYNGGTGSNISYKIEIPPITGYSTKSGLPDYIYIDLDIGEAYYIDANDEIASINNVVSIPAKLPVLTPGENEITYSDTITEFQIVPRWWQL